MSDNLKIFNTTYTDVTGFKAKNTSGNVLVFTTGGSGGFTPTGTKQVSITSNGVTIEDVTNYASVEITANVASSSTPEITISTSGAVTQELQPDTIYHFTSTALTSLTLTFGGTATDQYHFDFISPSTAATLTLPSTVTMESSFNVEANTKYEIDIVNNEGVYAEWAVSSV